MASCLPWASVSPRPEGSIACFAYKITRLGLRHARMRSGPTSADATIGRLWVLARQIHPNPSLRGLILGCVITLVFTAANVYLGLKVGLTFASTIPAAVISMAVLRGLRNATIYENNIVQTVASAAGTLPRSVNIVASDGVAGVAPPRDSTVNTMSPSDQDNRPTPRTSATARPRRQARPRTMHIAPATTSKPATSQPSINGRYWPSPRKIKNTK